MSPARSSLWLLVLALSACALAPDARQSRAGPADPIQRSRVVFLDPDLTTPRPALPRGSFFLWLAFISGDFYGNTSTGGSRPRLDAEQAFEADLGANQEEADVYALPARFAYEDMQIEPDDTELARIAPFVLDPHSNKILAASGWLDLATREYLFLAYFDRACTIRGRAASGDNEDIYDLVIPGAGYFWIRAESLSPTTHRYTETSQPAEVVVKVTPRDLTLQGKVDGGRYHPPSQSFEIPIPAGDPILQDYFEEAGGYVSFDGRSGGFSSVVYDRITPTWRRMLDGPGGRTPAHRQYLNQFALPEVFLKTSAETSILHQEVLGDAYFVVVAVPEGSKRFDAARNRRLDSVRGLLIFDEGDFIYMLVEETGSSTDWPRSVVDRLRETRESLTFGR